MEYIELNIFLIVLVSSFTAITSVPCNLSHSDNHICLHIYLERDFPLLHQMIINPHFIKEGREFDDACSPMTEMKNCYEDMLSECSVYWHFEQRAHILRVILAIQGVHKVLCSNRSIVLQELVLAGTCLESARREGHCDESSGVEAAIDFPKMMRFQKSWEMCTPLDNYRECLVNYSKPKCHPPSVDYLEKVLSTWNHYFCYAQLRDDVPIPSHHLKSNSYKLYSHSLFIASIIILIMNFSGTFIVVNKL